MLIIFANLLSYGGAEAPFPKDKYTFLVFYFIDFNLVLKFF